uniref:Uncharacterized protein n=1 Tax=Setaria viridis TaxID=4556 RepID=A0A4U6T958_SETVI|nr:hypothetical protein SEVIR_9G455433v2 [Setaria viridis]
MSHFPLLFLALIETGIDSFWNLDPTFTLLSNASRRKMQPPGSCSRSYHIQPRGSDSPQPFSS